MALRDVNLLPEEVLQRRHLVRHAIGWGIIYCITLALLLGGYLQYTHRAAPQRGTISEEQARKQLAQIISEIGIKNEEIERLAFVRHVTFAFGTSEILGRLADIMDPKTWLTKVSLRATEEETYTLMMKGLSYSNARLGTTIRALTTDDYFEDVVFKDAVDVKQSTRTSGAPESIVQFTMEATVRAE